MDTNCSDDFASKSGDQKGLRRPIDYRIVDPLAISKHVQWFSNTQAGSEPFGKFCTVLLFSTGYKRGDVIRSACTRFVLIVQPLQFHYSLEELGCAAQDSEASSRQTSSNGVLSISLGLSRHLGSRSVGLRSDATISKKAL